MVTPTRLIAVLLLLLVPPTMAWDQGSLLRLARAAVRAEVEGRPPPSVPTVSPPRPVFVTIERRGRVLGCRGGLTIRRPSLEEEVIHAARAAAAHDPRYPPLTPRDLTDFAVTVTVVRQLLPLGAIDSLLPSEGLVLRSGSRTGVVLPWEGKDPRLRLQWAFKKAGMALCEGASLVSPASAVTLHRLIGERFRG